MRVTSTLRLLAAITLVLSFGSAQARPKMKSADISQSLSQKYEESKTGSQTKRSLAGSSEKESVRADWKQKKRALDNKRKEQRFAPKDTPRLQYWKY